jgi:hypothetical protein
MTWRGVVLGVRLGGVLYTVLESIAGHDQLLHPTPHKYYMYMYTYIYIYDCIHIYTYICFEFIITGKEGTAGLHYICRSGTGGFGTADLHYKEVHTYRPSHTHPTTHTDTYTGISCLQVVQWHPANSYTSVP